MLTQAGEAHAGGSSGGALETPPVKSKGERRRTGQKELLSSDNSAAISVLHGAEDF